MRWPWSPEPRRKPTAPPGDLEEASLARRHAEEALAQAREQTGEVRQVADVSRRHLRVNHFAELLRDAFGGIA